ncbi:hypothetical protein C1645_774360, partial [Glomus cerebriforme]
MILINNKREFYKKYHKLNKRDEIKHHIRDNKINIINLRQKHYNYNSNSKKHEMNCETCYDSPPSPPSSPPPPSPSSSLSSSSSLDSNIKTESTLNMPIVFGITSAFLVFIMILFLIIKKTNSIKKFSFFCAKENFLFKENNENKNNDNIERTISVKYNNDKNEGTIKLPTPVATISSSSRSYSSIPKFSNSSNISISTSDSSRYDFLKAKINYLDQDFDNYFKPVHSLFEKDLVDEINETIVKDDFKFPVEEVNWEECM